MGRPDEKDAAVRYEVEMRHTEKTFESLAHMQYDLFCKGNRVGRMMISIVLIFLGISEFSSWWGILIVAYACYLMTSTYSSANHTAHKLASQIRDAGLQFPASRYIFREDGMEIVNLRSEEEPAERLAYSDVYRLGEDAGYFYIFRDRYGGYMVPKEGLHGREDEFRSFLQHAAGQIVRVRAAPIIRLLRWISDHSNVHKGE